MQTADSYVNEWLDHLGMVAGVCEEIGLNASRLIMRHAPVTE